MTGSVDMFPDAAIEYLIEHAPEDPKPKVESLDVEILSTWGGTWRLAVVRWGISCPCMPADRFAAVGSWDAALEIALTHGRLFHDA
jgi:hypothetical protein